MRRLIGVGVILLLGLGVFATRAEAQGNPGRDRGSRLGPNYPNPFNPETYIPFTLVQEDFQGGRPAVVTIKIYSVLLELVAHPTAIGRAGEEVNKLEYTDVGKHTAFWNGFDRRGRKVGSGVYIVQLEINGRNVSSQKILVTK
jgi:hypothetical protein